MRTNEPVTGRARDYPASYHLISTTDLKGKITAANDDFLEVAGFGIEELVDQPLPAHAAGPFAGAQTRSGQEAISRTGAMR